MQAQVKKYISTRQLAEMVGCHVDTLQRWRTAGSGPVPTKIGRLWKYEMADVDQWLQQERRGE
jgi:excisionase family DNA binding protein